MGEILNLSGTISKAHLVTKSVILFPFIPMWFGIQHIRNSLELNMEFNLLKNLMIRLRVKFRI